MTTPAPSTAIRRQKLDGEATHGRSDLPDGPLHIILMRLCSLIDLISFKSVCRSWRVVASSLPPFVITSHFPPLLLFPKHSLHHLCLSCLSGFGVLAPPQFRQIQVLGRLCYSHGHLLDSGLLVFTTGPLLYWRISSASWSCYWPKTKIRGDLGVVTLQGKVYAMNSLDYSLFVVDLYPKLHLRPLVVEGTKKDTFLPEHFLVDCGGELLQVQLVDTDDLHMHIEVFRLDLSVNGPRWVKKETLGNWAIFVGYNLRLSGLAVENPERWEGKSNCVYFNRVKENRDFPFAVFKLGDEIDMLDKRIFSRP